MLFGARSAWNTRLLLAGLSQSTLTGFQSFADGRKRSLSNTMQNQPLAAIQFDCNRAQTINSSFAHAGAIQSDLNPVQVIREPGEGLTGLVVSESLDLFGGN